MKKLLRALPPKQRQKFMDACRANARGESVSGPTLAWVRKLLKG